MGSLVIDILLPMKLWPSHAENGQWTRIGFFLFLLSAFSLVKILRRESDYGHLISDLVKITRENIKRSVI